MDNNNIISIGFDSEPKYIDISDMCLDLQDLITNNKYFETNLISYKDKEFIYVKIPKENFINIQNNEYFKKFLQINFTEKKFTKGKYKLSFSVIGGIDGKNIPFNVKQNNDRCKITINYHAGLIGSNSNLEKQIYNVFTQLRNSKNDIELNNKYFINITDIESVYNFSNFYKNNFLVSCELFYNGNDINFKILKENDNIDVDFSHYHLYLTDFKLEKLN